MDTALQWPSATPTASRRLLQSAPGPVTAAVAQEVPECLTSILPLPTIYPKNQSDEYVIVRTGTELADIVNASPSPTRHVRFPAGPVVIDLGPLHLVPPENTSTVLDCQGSILTSSSQNRPLPSTNSRFDIFDCVLVASVENNNSIAAVSVFSDVRMLLGCEDLPRGSSFEQLIRLSAPQGGLYLRNTTDTSGPGASTSYNIDYMRNVTIQCAEDPAVVADIQCLSDRQSAASTALPVWFVATIASVGVVVALLCLCMTLCRPWRRLKTYRANSSHDQDAASSPKSCGSTQQSVFKDGDSYGKTPLSSSSYASIPGLRDVGRSAAALEPGTPGGAHPLLYTDSARGRQGADPQPPARSDVYPADVYPSGGVVSMGSTAPASRGSVPTSCDGGLQSGAPLTSTQLSSTPFSAADDASAIYTSMRSDVNDAADVRFDSAGSQSVQNAQLMRSAGADATNTSTDGFLTTTRSGHIPTSHMDVLDTMSTIGPGMQRACWKGVPATVQSFEFVVPTGSANAGAAPMFAGAVAQNISHPHVISTFVHEVTNEEREGATVFKLRLVQELCLGGSLAGLMEGGWLGTTTGGLHIGRVMTLLRHVASGMVHLHRLRLVNGDLDPSHVLLQLDEADEQALLDASRDAPWTPLVKEAAAAITTGGCRVRLSNFGWTCLPTGGLDAPAGGGHGSHAYWSPERRRSDLAGPPAQVYSFGAMMWAMYVTQEPRLEAGAMPHPKLGRFPASTPTGFVLLTAACLSPLPEDRPQFEQVVQVLNDLQRELDSHYYTDLCGSTQSVERLAYRFDRGTLMDPELAMSSMSDHSLVPLMNSNPYARAGRSAAPAKVVSQPREAAGSEMSTTKGSSTNAELDRMQLPPSVVEMLDACGHYPR